MEAFIIANSKIINRDGESVPFMSFKDANPDTIVGLYFSAHWCPPCQSFTPKLATKYQELRSAGCPLEIIFLSSDRTKEDFEGYFREMPWLAMDFSESSKKQMLASQFSIPGIPSLVLMSCTGKVLTKDGRTALMDATAESFSDLTNFEAKQKEKESQLEAALESLPSEVTYSSHRHPLVKMRCPYPGEGFGCDVCSGAGKGWSYRCAQCGFDAHPTCVTTLPTPTPTPSTPSPP